MLCSKNGLFFYNRDNQQPGANTAETNPAEFARELERKLLKVAEARQGEYERELGDRRVKERLKQVNKDINSGSDK